MSRKLVRIIAVVISAVFLLGLLFSAIYGVAYADTLQEQLDKRGIKAVAKRVKDYRKGELDSTCKIINRIKHSELEEKNLDCTNVINDE